MTRFFRDYNDNSEQTISEAASFLKRVPRRQGRNQSLEEVADVMKIFDDKFKKHPDHLNLITRKKYDDMTPQ